MKLADRMKAMQWISDHMDLATPEQKEKVKLLQAQRRKLEDDGPEETEDDGFIEALKGQVDDLWQEE